MNADKQKLQANENQTFEKQTKITTDKPIKPLADVVDKKTVPPIGIAG